MKHKFHHGGVSLLAFVSACSLDGHLGQDPSPPFTTGTDDDREMVGLVEVEPTAPLDAAPPVLRLHVHVPPEPADLDRVRLFEGELTDGQLHYAGEAVLSSSLSGRLVPTTTWFADDGLVVAPSRTLREGAKYTLMRGEERLAVLTVSDTDTLPTFALAWPPEGASSTGWLGVWCHPQLRFDVEIPVFLEPSSMTGVLRSGIAPGEPSRRCVHFEPASLPGAEAQASLAPPVVTSADGSRTFRLEPTPLHRTSIDAGSSQPKPCPNDAVPFGPGCAWIEDDRILLEPHAADLLWSVQSAASAGVDQVFASDGHARYLWPLSPDSTLLLAVTALDRSGGLRSWPIVVRTAPPMAHLVIDEVLANPVGPEPEQEWVEIVNDGLAPAELEGVRLADVGGEAVLPAVTLHPGRRALLVTETYDASGKYDPAPTEGALIVRLKSLGKDGLSNAGEPLELLSPDGKVLSRFPARKTKAGRSIYRAHPRSLVAFFESKPGGSTPGESNEAMSAEAGE